MTIFLKLKKRLFKKISAILDLDIFFPSDSIKDINNGEIDVKTLNQLAYEAKNYCKKTLEHKRIIHMFIKNYMLIIKVTLYYQILKEKKSY